MRMIDKVKKKSPLTKQVTVKINTEIEADIAKFEKEFPEADLPKMWRVGIYMAMEAVRNEV